MIRSAIASSTAAACSAIAQHAVSATAALLLQRRCAGAPSAAPATATAATPTSTTASTATTASATATSASSAANATPAAGDAAPTPAAAAASAPQKQRLLKEGMRVSAFATAAGQHPVAIGSVVAQLAENIYSVRFEVPDSGTVVEVGTRVVAEKGDGTTAAGLVAHVNGDATFGILYDNDVFEPAVPREKISVSGGRLAMSSKTYGKYSDVVDWIQRSAGVQKRTDILSAAIILYRRGWRRENLYLLEYTDLACLTHLNKSVRAGILEAAEDEKVKRRLKREIQNERMKEASSVRFFVVKYSGVLGTMIAACGVMSVFFWNFTNYRRQQRPAQVQAAVNSMLKSLYRRAGDGAPDDSALYVPREEAARLCRFLESIDPTHPQLVFLTGSHGSGKSSATVEAARSIGSPFVVVELRGSDKNDPIRAIVKSCGVTSMDLCGDLFQFTAEVCGELRRLTGKLPTIILKPRGAQIGGGVPAGSAAAAAAGAAATTSALLGGGVPVSLAAAGGVKLDLGYALNDALSLVSDRHCANVIVELDSEALLTLPHMPRTSVFHVGDMTVAEATQYLAHRVDPVAVPELIDTVGTNSIDLDECVNQVLQHGRDIDDVICARLSSAVNAIRRQDLQLQALLSEVAAQPFHVGVRARSADIEAAVYRGFLMWHHEQHCWMFKNKLFWEAARIVSARY